MLNFSRPIVLMVALLAIVAAARGDAADKGAAEGGRAAVPPPVIGEMHVQTLAPITYAYVEADTSFDKLGEAIGQAMGELGKATEAGAVRPAGAFVLIYPHGGHHRPAEPFPVQIGFIVAEGAKEHGSVKVRKTEPFKCATVLYTGPVMQEGQAWQKLIPAMEGAGLAPTGEEREFTMYFESRESPNNVVLVQAGVK